MTVPLDIAVLDEQAVHVVQRNSRHFKIPKVHASDKNVVVIIAVNTCKDNPTAIGKLE